MSKITTLAVALAFMFTAFMSCDSGSEDSKNSKNKPNTGATESGEVEGAGEAQGGTAEAGGETNGGSEGDISYAADETLFYADIEKSVARNCLSCHPPNIPQLSVYESLRNNAEDIKTMLMDPSTHPDTTITNVERAKLVNWILAGTKKSPSSLSFEKPLKLNTPVVGNTFEVKVSIGNNRPDATWKLFYTTTANTTAGGTLIGGDQSLSGKGVLNWNVSALPPGTYYLYAELKDGAETAVTKEPVSLRFGLPSIVLGQGWREGSKAFLSTADLTYAVQHGDMTKIYKVNLAVKSGAGAYQNIVMSNTDLTKYKLPGSYTFSNGVAYTFKATLVENNSEVHSDESAGLVGIATAAISYAALRTQIIDAKCGECHAGSSAIGSYKSDLYSTPTGAKANAAEIVHRLSDPNEPMPPPPKSLLTTQEQATVKLWYWLGADP